jgi:peroxiredoxin Q/BCP
MSEVAWLEEGSKAPAFSLKDQTGKTVKLSEFKGQPVVVYFYPKDDTPGCTKEACAFRDQQSELEKLGAIVLGISPDDQASHAKFSEKFSLNFPLLVDTDHKVAEKFGAWREKNMYGKISMGVQRSTFLIDSTGKVAKVWKRVQVDGHDQQVIEAVKKL